jgi:hypothetical protein
VRHVGNPLIWRNRVSSIELVILHVRFFQIATFSAPC